jgi:hypothetical protein
MPVDGQMARLSSCGCGGEQQRENCAGAHLLAAARLLTDSSIHFRIRSAICRWFLSCMIMWLLPRMQRVGYLSASQFTREYGRFFGSAPTRDVARLREEGFAPSETDR